MSFPKASPQRPEKGSAVVFTSCVHLFEEQVAIVMDVIAIGLFLDQRLNVTKITEQHLLRSGQLFLALVSLNDIIVDGKLCTTKAKDMKEGTES